MESAMHITHQRWKHQRPEDKEGYQRRPDIKGRTEWSICKRKMEDEIDAGKCNPFA